MNRHELEQRLRTVEAKLKFVMNTLSVTRVHNETGKKDALTFDSIFEAGVQRGVDTPTTQDVAGHPVTQAAEQDTGAGIGRETVE